MRRTLTAIMALLLSFSFILSSCITAEEATKEPSIATEEVTEEVTEETLETEEETEEETTEEETLEAESTEEETQEEESTEEETEPETTGHVCEEHAIRVQGNTLIWSQTDENCHIMCSVCKAFLGWVPHEYSYTDLVGVYGQPCQIGIVKITCAHCGYYKETLNYDSHEYDYEGVMIPDLEINYKADGSLFSIRRRHMCQCKLCGGLIHWDSCNSDGPDGSCSRCGMPGQKTLSYDMSLEEKQAYVYNGNDLLY